MKKNRVPIFSSAWIDNNENRFMLFLVTILMITGCNYVKSPNSNDQNASEKTDTLAAVTDLNITPEKLCFMSETRWKDPSPEFKNAMDILRLEITITGKNVYGIYNWIPYAKDSKIGSFVGTIEKEKIRAKYVYQQEGIYTAEDIEIVLTDTNAVLNGVNIPKITCPEY
jgi:hypothetical protein